MSSNFGIAFVIVISSSIAFFVFYEMKYFRKSS